MISQRREDSVSRREKLGQTGHFLRCNLREPASPVSEITGGHEEIDLHAIKHAVQRLESPIAFIQVNIREVKQTIAVKQGWEAGQLDIEARKPQSCRPCLTEIVK